MRVTEKGQVTIPKHIRDKLGIGPGSEVDFVDVNGCISLVKTEADVAGQLRAGRIMKWIDRVSGTSDAGLTTDDVMRMTRGGDGDPD